MSDTNCQLKEGDPFAPKDIKARLREDFAQELCFNGMRERTIYADAANHIESQQQRIEALEQELADARKDAARYQWLRDIDNQMVEDDVCVSDSSFNTYFGNDLDTIIDAAMKEQA